MKTKFLLFVVFASLHFIKATRESGKNDTKNGRIFSLFSLVNFKNLACTTTTDKTMKGTCYTSSECLSKGGTSGGNCAAGFGVCCMFTLSTCGSTVTQNCSYIQNPGYPSSFSTVSTTCSYSVAPVQTDICQLRLDFNNFVTQVSTVAATAGACIDSFIATSPTGPVTTSICGTNTNQHMYIETGSSKTSTPLTFTIAATTGTRTWKIKVSQIECSNPGKAPADCRQYFTGATGTFSSYNYAGAQMLQSQQYTNCFRQELGYCGIDYTEASTITPDAFQLGTNTTNGLTGITQCTMAGITIPTDNNNGQVFCGSNLVSVNTNTAPTSIRDTTSPFIVATTSNAVAETGAIGYNLVYSQVPCA